MAETRNPDGARVKLMSPLITGENNVGIAIRTIREFFQQKEKIKEHLREKFLFYVSFYQIYNEQVYDLLNFEEGRLARQLKVRYTGKEQFVVENLFLYECVNAQEAITLYNQGIRNKIVSSHKMNHASSRSHCIFSIQVDQISDDGLHELKTTGHV